MLVKARSTSRVGALNKVLRGNPISEGLGRCTILDYEGIGSGHFVEVVELLEGSVVVGARGNIRCHRERT